MVEQAIDLVKMRAYECAKIIINNRNVDGLAKLIIKHEEFKAKNQALRETLKELTYEIKRHNYNRSNPQLYKAVEVADKVLALAIQGEPE